jgi:hypothetical protein
VGFHDLDGGGDDEAEVVPPVVAETQYDTCIVKSDVDGCSGGGGCASWSAPTCDAGWDELAQPRICGSGGQVVASTTPGVMVSGINQVTLTSGNIGWGVCDTWEETQYIATTTLNGGPIGTTICEWSTTTSSFDSDGVCEYVTESGAAPTLGRGGVHGTMCCLPRPETP